MKHFFLVISLLFSALLPHWAGAVMPVATVTEQAGVQAQPMTNHDGCPSKMAQPEQVAMAESNCAYCLGDCVCDTGACLKSHASVALLSFTTFARSMPVQQSVLPMVMSLPVVPVSKEKRPPKII